MKLADVRAGDMLIADGGFSCLEAGPHEVKADPKGELFIDCADGGHYLSGQEDQNGELVGLEKRDHHPVDRTPGANPSTNSQKTEPAV